MESYLDLSVAVQTRQEISDTCQDLGQIIPCFDGVVLFNLDSLLLNLQDVSSPFLDIIQSVDGQVGIFRLAWTFLKPVLPQMELIWSVIKGVGKEAGVLDFLIHFNWMLEDKASKNTILMLSELLEMIKLIRVDVFLVEQLKYKANLMVPAKEQILGLHERLQLLRVFLATVKKMNRLLSDSLIEKNKNVKAEEGTTTHLHDFRSSVSNWPRAHELGFIYFLLGYLRVLLNCRTHFIVSVKCQIEVLLRHLKSETIRVTTLVGLNDQLEFIINQLRRESLHLDIVSTVGMPGFGKTTSASEEFEF
ncbi:uncharacterized protein [Coffea arabica]|uniref:NB-ARC domain-containing protein n=1 Tax=Coffea arabica TaxID=13443 RepID=A0ABM4VTL7_COFAR